MRLLLYVEPLIMHNRPLHYWAWLDRAAAIGHALRATGGGHEIRLVTNEALAGRAVAPPGPGNEVNRRKHEGLPPEWVVPLSESLLRRHFDAPNVAILEGLHHGRWPAERVQACGQDLRAALSGFEPDVILTFTPSDHLASAFPGALVLHSEFGFFSRHPFPVTHYFDPLGLYARSTLGVHAEALLARRPDAREHAWLDGLREELRAWLLAASPFGGLEMELRRRFRRVVLLPLQFGGEAGFDVNGPFRNQAEYLFHVLERLPDSVGLIVTEHPSARLLGDSFDDETREHLRSRWPQAVFVDPSVVLHGSQMLLLHADAVICLSSSLGLQALFWRKPLVSPGWSHLAPYASVHSLADLDPGRDLDPIADRDGVVGWMVRHYFIPEPLCLNDPEWLERFLRVSLDRHAAGRLGLDFYDPIAGDDAIRGFYRAPAPAALRSTVRADILRNGRFEQ
ncbi:MAG: hypothetical protein QUU85_11585, partial [Candidatus Eisenbacteria bacterium]|nr:hypothetical protein [Candidatus Eisenbacteria bacterium]